MKIIKILRIVIIITVIILLASSIWMNTVKFETSKTYNLLYKTYNNSGEGLIKLTYKSDVGLSGYDTESKQILQRKSNGDIYSEYISSTDTHFDYETSSYITTSNISKMFFLGNKKYQFDNNIQYNDNKNNEDKTYSVNNISDFDIDFINYYKQFFCLDSLNNFECAKRSYQLLDNKLYYVETFNSDNYMNKNPIKFFFDGDNLAFFGDENDRIYIDSYSSEIDESLFELPTGYTLITDEN